jgi:hypothetical protein
MTSQEGREVQWVHHSGFVVSCSETFQSAKPTSPPSTLPLTLFNLVHHVLRNHPIRPPTSPDGAGWNVGREEGRKEGFLCVGRKDGQKTSLF